ncbi:hypothetical protein BLOT_004510 [Blomia tropicalis]|nr:hypothetical protein BLOT_004510 [Blomia tropicalis]
MFSRFLAYVRKGNDDDDDENRRDNSNNNSYYSNNKSNKKGKAKYAVAPKNISSDTMEESMSSSSTTTEEGSKKRRVREDYRIKYAYLDYSKSIDMRGLECLADDIRSSLEVLKNSYLSVVNSLVILDERRRKRRQNMVQSSNVAPQESNGAVQTISSNFINVKVADNFRNSDQDYLSNYSDTYQWSIDKFCDPATRENEFNLLFQESQKYISTVERIKLHYEPINMNRFQGLVREGKNLLGIIELLNNNYSNNFLDIFRIS